MSAEEQLQNINAAMAPYMTADDRGRMISILKRRALPMAARKIASVDALAAMGIGVEFVPVDKKEVQ